MSQSWCCQTETRRSLILRRTAKKGTSQNASSPLLRGTNQNDRSRSRTAPSLSEQTTVATARHPGGCSQTQRATTPSGRHRKRIEPSPSERRISATGTTPYRTRRRWTKRLLSGSQQARAMTLLVRSYEQTAKKPNAGSQTLTLSCHTDPFRTLKEMSPPGRSIAATNWSQSLRSQIRTQRSRPSPIQTSRGKNLTLPSFGVTKRSPHARSRRLTPTSRLS
mmetsp:Transcript_14199/g.33869  ORF Transcript_14199/g.33869 Transcript_14199/m.33869 type:complete len:221 (-) Transcript_14199:1350-2012(-)